ncbi:hypothetical protein [Alteromonas sp. KUL49]|uniref:hypothetical protein n=1 Tax=Alteromonas sp. KUL49 TaxID=2480798 RepID=UPI00102F0C37|nr:hypothetical protein [Alteromonas sp. KUL49]TAP40955.1 hypothetical protein EYS00_07565 [Alteromonas sp. KUL49]GEA11138.1 hypothetical protein KUL49_15130 [Alteromonas sp. KUL49]
MKKALSILFVYLVSLATLANEPLHESELRELTQRFIEAKNQRQQPDSTPKDVDYFLSFLADEFKDEHVKFKEHAKGQPSHMDEPVEYTAINIMSLEFNDHGKIIHIRRHHGL